jgi:hypothetical protein
MQFQVHQSGTYAQAIQNECMQVWNISAGGYQSIIYTMSKKEPFILVEMLLFDSAYNASTIPRNLKVH